MVNDPWDEPVVTIRPAKGDDLQSITDVFFDCWHITYPEVLPPDLISRMDRPSADALWTRVFREHGGSDLLVAEREVEHHSILGVTRFGMGASVGKIHSLYVSPHAQGGGVGSALLTRVCDLFGEVGATTARLWVFEKNTPSRQFYYRHGFHPDGERRIQEEFGQAELRLSKTLEAARS